MSKSVNLLILSLILTWSCCLVYGFYVPGVAPQDFSRGDLVEVKVNI